MAHELHQLKQLFQDSNRNFLGMRDNDIKILQDHSFLGIVQLKPNYGKGWFEKLLDHFLQASKFFTGNQNMTGRVID